MSLRSLRMMSALRGHSRGLCAGSDFHTTKQRGINNATPREYSQAIHNIHPPIYGERTPDVVTTQAPITARLHCVHHPPHSPI